MRRKPQLPKSRWAIAISVAATLVSVRTALCEAPSPDVSSQPGAVPTTRPTSTQAAAAEAGLQAYIASLHPPTVDEILKSFGPIPSIEDLVKPLPGDLNLPSRRPLTAEDQARVEELENRIAGLQERGQYAAALPLAEQIVSVRASRQGINDPDTIFARHTEKILKLYAGLSPQAWDELRTAASLQARAGELQDQGQVTEARRAALQALAINSRILGEENLVVANMLWFGMLFRPQGDFHVDEKLSRDALTAMRKVYGDEDPRLPAMVERLADLLNDNGYFAQAEPLYLKAWALDRQVFRREQSMLETAVNSPKRDEQEMNVGHLRKLAHLLHQMGDDAGADTAFHELLRLHIKRYGNEYLAASSSTHISASRPVATTNPDSDVKAFDLEAYIAGLHAPTVDEIIKSLGPIPTIDELLKPVPDDSTLPPDRLLNAQDRARAEELEQNSNKLFRQQQYSQAANLQRELVAIKQRTLGADHPETVDALMRLSWMERVAQLSGEEQIALLRGAGWESVLYWFVDNGRTVEAKQLAQNVVANHCRLLGEHQYTGRDLLVLASRYCDGGLYQEAELLDRGAVSMLRRLLGEAHPDVSMALIKLGRVVEYQSAGKAELLYREAVAILRKAHRAQDETVRLALDDLARVYASEGDYATADRITRYTLAARRTSGFEGLPLAKNLQSLAVLLEEAGDSNQAEALSREVLAIRRRWLGGSHADVADSLLALAGPLTLKGDYTEAKSLCREATAILQKRYGPSHPRVIDALRPWARILAVNGEYTEAEFHLREALAISRKCFRDENVEAARILSDLGWVFELKGEYPEALELMREGLEMQRRLRGSEHPQTATCLLVLAELMLVTGDYAGTDSACREGLPIIQAARARDHPLVAYARTLLGLSSCLRSDYATAERLLTDAAEACERSRTQVGGSGLERVAFAAHLPAPAMLAAVRARLHRPAAAWDALQGYLSRGLLDMLTETHGRALTPKETAQEQELIHKLDQFETQIAAVAGRRNQDAESQHTLLGLRHDLDQTSAELSRFRQDMVGKYGVTEGRAFDWEHVQRLLSTDTAVIGWLDASSGAHIATPLDEHWAYILRARGDPVFVELPGAGPKGHWTAEDILAPGRVRGSLLDSTSATSELQAAIEALARQRLEPLMPFLKTRGDLPAVKHLIVIPAGWMNGIPIEALTDAYQISYAPSPTVYAWLVEQRDSKRRDSPPSLLAVGDPPFSREQWAQMQTEQKPALQLAMATHGSVGEVKLRQHRDAMAGNAEALNHLSRLPGTRREVRAIERAFMAAIEGKNGEGSARPPITVLLGADASEQRLAELAQSGRLAKYRYLHLATHGFIDVERPARSCLILSRVNLPDPLKAALEGKPVYDGRLTVQRIMNDWRLNADLVTLSACETGLGKESGGEGFVGFAQALLFRGARSIVLSLWKVDDTATMLLMARFYENLLGSFKERREAGGRVYEPGHPMPKAQALREAKQWLRSLPVREVRRLLGIQSDEKKWAEFLASLGVRGLGKTVQAAATQLAPTEVSDDTLLFEHPHYWAAFILIGDPE
jgi:CHAT domain-containing protein/tetratricopeptide (TPR) repeat protein